MFPEIARRLLATIPVMGVVAIAVFALLHATPGDPAVIIAGDYATGEDIARIRAKLGLDQPFLTQVGLWLGRIVRGDLGTSIFSGLPVDHPHRPARRDDGVAHAVRDADQRRHRRAGRRAGGLAQGLVARPRW